MKKLLLLIVLIISFQAGKAQTPSWVWAESSNGSYYEYSNGLFVDSADNLFLSGRYSGSLSFGTGATISGGNDNPFVTQLDTSGNSAWIHNINYGYYDYPRGFWRDRKNNTYTSGIVSSGASMFINKYNATGGLDWSITPSGGQIDGQAICADKAYNIYITGAFVGSVQFGSTPALNSSAGSSLFLAKLDSNGNFLWAIGGDPSGSGSNYVYPRGMTIDNHANVYITGGYSGNPVFGSLTVPATTGNPNLFIAEYDSSGNALNTITATNAGINIGDCCTNKGITIDSCDNLYVTGQYQGGDAQFGSFTLSNSGGGQDVYIAKCTNAGVWQWANPITATNANNADAIALDKYANVYVGGNYSTGAFLVKYDNSTGDQQWLSTFSGGGGFGAITVDQQDYVYVTGSYSGSITFGSITLNAGAPGNIFVAKLDTIPPRSIVPVINSSYCPGSTDTIPYSIAGSFNSGNTFTAQLSDSTGSFINSTNLGSISSTSNGKIVITIPANTPKGSNYLIRVVSSNPSTSSFVNGCGAYYSQNVYPNDFYVTIGGTLNVAVTATDTNVCSGGSITLKASVTGTASYLWSNGSTKDTAIVSPTTDTMYSVTVTTSGCTGKDSIKINVVQAPPLVITPQDTLFCNGQIATLFVNGGGSGFIWSPGSSLIDSSISGDSVLAYPSATTTYTVSGTNSGGCLVSGATVVTVVPSPNKPTFRQDGDTLISSSQFDNQWYYDGYLLNNDTSQDLIITKPGPYWVEVANEANGCSTSSDTVRVDTVSGINQIVLNNQLSIYPNPFNNNVFIKINSSVGNVSDWKLQITDVLGRTIYSQLLLNYDNNIDLSDLSNGVYFITVMNKSGRTVVPVIKQN